MLNKFPHLPTGQSVKPVTNARQAMYVQGVPLATEPGISVIILTPMKILQRNLNRNTFVV